MNLTPFAPSGGGAVLTTTALVFVSFLGFVKIAAVAEEISEPDKNLPRTLIGSVGLVTVLYVAIVLVLAGIFTQQTIVEIPDPLTQAARRAFGSVGGQAIIVAGLFATLSSANASILAASRINLAMSRDGLFPAALAKIDERTVTPVRAIVLTAGLSALLIVGLPNIEELAKIASSLQLYSYAAINVGARRAAVRRPGLVPARRSGYRARRTRSCSVHWAAWRSSASRVRPPQLAVLGLIVLSLAWYAIVRSRNEIDIDHAVDDLRARWSQLGLRALFSPPSAADPVTDGDRPGRPDRADLRSGPASPRARRPRQPRHRAGAAALRALVGHRRRRGRRGTRRPPRDGAATDTVERPPVAHLRDASDAGAPRWGHRPDRTRSARRRHTTGDRDHDRDHRRPGSRRAVGARPRDGRAARGPAAARVARGVRHRSRRQDAGPPGHRRAAGRSRGAQGPGAR